MASSGSSEAGSARGPVLIVDDNDALREAVAELLHDEGFETSEAPNGRIALDHLRGGLRPCVILLDLMMPIMNGWDFRHEQMNDPLLRDIPVLVLTAGALSAQSVRTQFGNAELVPKPCMPDALLNAIQRACGGPTSPS